MSEEEKIISLLRRDYTFKDDGHGEKWIKPPMELTFEEACDIEGLK
jgi:hypothetical protein